VTEPLRVCWKCNPPHYENCPACFGFGVLAQRSLEIGGYVPISAGRAPRIPDSEWLPCPICHSTPKGIPGSTRGEPG
jgi:hypothetical protein